MRYKEINQEDHESTSMVQMKKSKGSGLRPLLISLFHLKQPYNPKPKTTPGNQIPPSSRFQTIPQAITTMSD